MNSSSSVYFKYFLLQLVAISCVVLVSGEKYRLCVVDGKATFKKSATYCPTLDQPDSKVECIVALDRLDCLRRIHKNKADFAVFTPEDLVAATNSEIELLVTNKLRYTKDNNEYEVVAIIDNNSGIKTKHDLKDQRYCHPGYGYEADWTKIIANYFEASVVTPQCDPLLTITENRIKATSIFFEATCKAGPWVNNPILNSVLKHKYTNLCKLCDNSDRCSMQDKYWGRRGSLLCLTDGAGDVSWARWDDAKQHFGLTPGGSESGPDGYSLLCPDDTVMPLNTTEPCVWVVKPWPVVGARRVIAQEIQEVIASLSHEDRTSWRSNLLHLLQMSYAFLEKIEPVQPIISYLDNARGFLNANSFSGCHPPRTIKICTTSNLENAKCSWLRESAAVYGIEPDLECIKASNTTHCMMAVQENVLDIVMVPSDLVHLGMRQYNLKTLFYETVAHNDKYIVVPIIRSNSTYKNLEDLKGAKACFPTYDGVAWNSVSHFLHSNNIINSCNLDKGMAEFFGPSCVPGMPKKESDHLTQICEDDFAGEFGALHCLSSGAGEVAFVSKNSLDMFLSDEREDNPGNREKPEDFKILCDKSILPDCHLTWSSIGQAMVHSNVSKLWLSDTMDVFMQLDNLFGKEYQSLTIPFTMFGKYDGKSDVLFHDATVRLRNIPTAKNTDVMQRNYEITVLKHEIVCLSSSSLHTIETIVIILSSLLSMSRLIYF